MATPRHRLRQEKSARDSSSHVESRQLATQPSGPRANYFLIATASGRRSDFQRSRIRSDIRSDCKAGSLVICGEFPYKQSSGSSALPPPSSHGIRGTPIGPPFPHTVIGQFPTDVASQTPTDRLWVEADASTMTQTHDEVRPNERQEKTSESCSAHLGKGGKRCSRN